jgi:hypothetical protein
MAGEARGAAQVGELAPMKATEARQGALLFKSDSTGVEAVMIDAMREGAPSEETREKVVELALTHHLVTKYTSLIAIDRTPARPVDADLKIAALPTNLPEGWNHDALFGTREADSALVGRLPQGATDSRFNLLSGALALLFATLLFRLAQARPPAAAATVGSAESRKTLTAPRRSCCVPRYPCPLLQSGKSL